MIEAVTALYKDEIDMLQNKIETCENFIESSWPLINKKK